MIIERTKWAERELTRTWIRLDSIVNIKPISQVSGICINNEGKMILVRDPKRDYWSLLEGRPIGKETYRQTLRREANEEAT